MLEMQGYMGLQVQSLDLGLGFLGDDGECKPHLCLTEGCFCLRGKHQAGVQRQRELEVWAMEAWSDNLHLDDCEVGAHRNPSLPAHGSSPSDAGVMECIYPPLKIIR